MTLPAGTTATRDRAPTWLIIAGTLMAVLVAGGMFVAGLVTGVAMSGAQTGSGSPSGGGVAPGSRPDSGGTTPGGPGTASAAPAGDFDPCLVGTWRSVEHTETFDIKDQGPTTISGVVRTLSFDAAGNEAVTYDNSQATVKVKEGEGSVTYNGTVKYRVSTNAGKMTFSLVSADGTVSIRKPDGSEDKQPLKPGAGAVSYTCSATQFTQEAEGFRSSYTKAG